MLADAGCGKMPYYGMYRDLAREVIAIDWPSQPARKPARGCAVRLSEGIELADQSIDTELWKDRPARKPLWPGGSKETA